jgi:hypothetical protein
MYRTRLQAWNLLKNMKFSQKEELLYLINKSHLVAPGAPPSNFNLGSKELRKLARHSKTMARIKKRVPSRPLQLDISRDSSLLEPCPGQCPDVCYAANQNAISSMSGGLMLQRGPGECLTLLLPGLTEHDTSHASAQYLTENNLSIELNYSE